MLVLSGILLVIGCSLVLYFVLSFHACQKQLATVESNVREQVDRKVREAQAVDTALVQRVCEGRTLGESIDLWQMERAAILETGRTENRWRWTPDDLKQWMQERIRQLADGIRRKYLLGTIITSVCAVLITGTVCLVYYNYYAAHRSAHSDQLLGIDDLDATFHTPTVNGGPSADSTAVNSASPSASVPLPDDLDALLSP